MDQLGFAHWGVGSTRPTCSCSLTPLGIAHWGVAGRNRITSLDLFRPTCSCSLTPLGIAHWGVGSTRPTCSCSLTPLGIAHWGVAEGNRITSLDLFRPTWFCSLTPLGIAHWGVGCLSVLDNGAHSMHNPLAGVRIGQAKVPGPMSSFDCMDCDRDFDEHEPDDVDPPWLLDDHLDESTHNIEGEMRGCHFNLHDALFPSVVEAQLVAGNFKGAKFGMVYTTRRGVTGYYTDVPYSGVEDQLCLCPFNYLQIADCLGDQGKVPIQLEPLLKGLYSARVLSQGRSRRSRRRPKRVRSKVKGRVLGPIPEIGTFFTGVPIGDLTHRELGLFAIDTCNGNNHTGALSFLEGSSAEIVCHQELRVSGAMADTTSRQAKRCKWSLAIEDANPTDQGSYSAGVGVAVRSRIGHSNCDNLMWFAELGGRIRVSFVNAVLTGGLYVVSIYLWHSEGLSERNLTLLHSLGRLLASLRAPWIVAGDWNIIPSLLEKSGWLSLVKGRIHAAGSATCHLNEYDYFVLDARLSRAVVCVRPISEAGISPHIPVRLYLRGNARRLMVRVIISPTKIPAFLPAGCLPLWADQGWDSIAPEDSVDTFSRLGLEKAIADWYDRSEGFMADILSLDCKQAAKMCGRSAGTRIVTQPALGKPGSADPKFSKVTVAWKSCKHWLGDLAKGHKLSHPSPLRFRADKARWHLLYHDWNSIGASRHADAFLCWRQRLNKQVLECSASLSYLYWAVSQISERTENYDTKLSERTFQSWLREGPSRVTSSMYFMTRVQGGWIPSCYHDPEPDDDHAAGDDDPDSRGLSAVCDDECTASELLCALPPLDGQAEVECLGDFWASQWGADMRVPEITWGDLDLQQPLPTITIDIARRGAGTFPGKTGLGWDKFHPRCINRMPDAAVLALIRIFILVELFGHWPASIGLVVVSLIPKSDGGRRPIGLLPSLIRLWMRIRLEVAKEWQLANERAFFYAGPLKGANVAAWKQAAQAELASYSRFDEYLCMLLDLVKAFDRVPHKWLVLNAQHYGFPLLILRVSMAAYLLGRVICVDGIVSRVIFATRSITAGSVLATIEMRLVLIKRIDETVYRFPDVDITVFVDDTSLEGVGPLRKVLHNVTGATRYLTEGLIDMELELSPTKNVAVASRSALAKAAADQLPLLHLKIANQAKSLGAAIAAGKRRNVSVLKKRLKDFRARIPLFKRMRRNIGAQCSNVLLQTGGVPALVYGQFTTGVSCSLLHTQRVAVASAGNAILVSLILLSV